MRLIVCQMVEVDHFSIIYLREKRSLVAYLHLSAGILDWGAVKRRKNVLSSLNNVVMPFYGQHCVIESQAVIV